MRTRRGRVSTGTPAPPDAPRRPRGAGLDQTRGWFYTLMVLSTALFGRPAFRNLVCNGLVLAADGKKMSKRLRNYPVRPRPPAPQAASGCVRQGAQDLPRLRDLAVQSSLAAVTSHESAEAGPGLVTAPRPRRTPPRSWTSTARTRCACT